ncbi:MAG: glycosyltransferase family 2 protein [Pseudomonadota bacterium]
MLHPAPANSQTSQTVPKSPTPKVSIGLPVFNGDAFLAEAVESILDQSFNDFELILCDNASTDGTEEICRHFAHLDARVRYIRHEKNLGAAANYNRAFEEARGMYFKWGAHDDNLHREFLAECVVALDADPDCLLAYTETVLIDEHGIETGQQIDRFASLSRDPAERLSTWLSLPTGLCNPVFGLIRREEMAKTIRHGTYMGADRVLLGEIALRGRSFMIEKPLFYRRMHPNISTLANPGFLKLTQWFTGKKLSGLRFKRWRQLGGFLGVVNRIEKLTVRDRWRSRAVILRWAMALRSEFLKELMLPLYVNGQDTALKTWMRTRGKTSSTRATGKQVQS